MHINSCKFQALIDLIVNVSGASRKRILTNLIKREQITTLKEFQEIVDKNGLEIYNLMERGDNIDNHG